MTRLALTGGTVVASLSPPRVLDADVVVDGERVAGVGTAPAGTPARDCSGCLILPGNVCAHTHLYSALARGMPYRLASPSTFLEILQRVWWRLDRALDEETVRASALAGGLEALLAGTTTLVDHHASPNAIDGSLDVIAEALASLGLRSVLCYETSDRDGPDRAVAGVRENRRFLSRVAAGTFPLARGMVGAHASFTLSEETLSACVEAARDAGAGIHIHAAEDSVDERDASERFGTRVAHRLAAAGALDRRTLLAHGVHLDDGELAAVRDAGAAIAHNPRSNMNNAVGRARVAAMGTRVALGTDGIGADMFEESHAAFFRLREDDVHAGGDWPLARLAEGAALAGEAFGESALGRIEPGAPADLAVLDYAAPAPVEAATLAGHWTFGLSSRAVRDVLVAGELVVADRLPTRVDAGQLVAAARAATGVLWRRLDEIPAHAFEPKGVR